MFKIAFLVAMCVAGITEWLKNLLPAKVKENSIDKTINENSYKSDPRNIVFR